MYDIYEDGLKDFGRSLLFRKSKRSRDPLAGMVDGSNPVFFTPFQPLLSEATTTVYNAGSPIGAGAYSVDLETGCIVFAAPPTIQPQATYTNVDLTPTQIQDTLFRGFAEFESQMQQGYRLSSGSAVYAQATGDEAAVWVMAATTATDPSFETSLAKRAAYVACCELVMLESQANYSAAYDFSYREDRGMAVDKSRVAGNLEAAIERQRKVVAAKVAAAQTEIYGDSALGAYIPNPHSADYDANFDWHDDDGETG